MAEVEDSNSSINGLLSTPNFLEAQLDWSAESFPHFKTPNKKSRERTESETSSNTDFNTVGGIAGRKTSQPQTFQPQASTPDHSTPDFSTMNFFQAWTFQP